MSNVIDFLEYKRNKELIYFDFVEYAYDFLATDEDYFIYGIQDDD